MTPAWRIVEGSAQKVAEDKACGWETLVDVIGAQGADGYPATPT